MKFVYKLLIGYGIPCIIIGIILIYGNETVKSTFDSLHSVIKEQVRALAEINRLHYRANQIRLLEVELFENSDYYTVTGGVNNLNDLAESFEQELRDFVSTFIVEEDEKADLLLSSWGTYRKGLERSLQHVKSMNMTEAKKVSRYNSFPGFQVLSKNMDMLSSEIEKRTQQSYDDSVIRIKAKRHLFLLISIVGITGGIIVALVLSRSISRRIMLLRTGALRLADGNMKDLIPIEGGDELTDLAFSFNEMTKKLQSTTTSVDNLNREVTQRKKAEETMKKLNRDLENTVNKLAEANNNLKAFVYIASHDLREPLRKITSFGALLKESLESKLSKDDAENLNYMVDGARRMTQMIEGLLSYSRISTKGQPAEVIDLNELVKQLKELELAVLIGEKNVELEIPQELPFVEADPTQMAQLLQNLIANGIKYQPKNNRPHIAITSRPVADGMVRIQVTDNGIGISPENRQVVFAMFRRLHSKNEYEGTGIGLAVCKKIVERHGGEIGIESQSGRGSTFWFTVPVAQTPASVAS
jgi:signal transduction histidine kinase